MGGDQRHPAGVSALEPVDAYKSSLQTVLGAVWWPFLHRVFTLHDPALAQEPFALYHLI
jgi:hypothetical protein